MKPDIASQLTSNLGGKWQAVRDGFSWYYVQEGTSRVVRCYSESVLGWDGYSDEDFVTVYVDNDGVEVGRCGIIHRKEI
jgi:hypothetical protein